MKKVAVLFIMILCCFLLVSALADDEISVEKYSLFNIDYGEEVHMKKSYYVAYIKNNSEDPVYLNSFDLLLYGEYGEKLEIEDHYAYDRGSLYLDPQETSCISFMTYFGDDNYDKTAVTAELKCSCIKNDSGYLDVNLDSSNSSINSWYDSSQYGMYATIKNKNIKETDKVFHVVFVVEDQNSNPIYIESYPWYSVPKVGKELTVAGNFNDSHLKQFDILKEYFLRNNITPIKVNVFCYYEVGDKYLSDLDYYDPFDMD